MAEGYSDEELDEGIRPPRVEPHVAFFIGRLGMTIERLQRERDDALLDRDRRQQRVKELKGEIENMDQENTYLMRGRDEARRVARSVARDLMTYLLNGTLPESPDVDTALAYPEVEP